MSRCKFSTLMGGTRGNGKKQGSNPASGPFNRMIGGIDEGLTIQTLAL